jgi:hypothetical protein
MDLIGGLMFATLLAVLSHELVVVARRAVRKPR